jgi:hypothetical protein
MFRPLTGHHHVVYLIKRTEVCTIYNVTLEVTLYIVQPLSLDVQPDDGLLETETCSC